jgi:hypothetical protein
MRNIQKVATAGVSGEGRKRVLASGAKQLSPPPYIRPSGCELIVALHMIYFPVKWKIATPKSLLANCQANNFFARFSGSFQRLPGGGMGRHSSATLAMPVHFWGKPTGEYSVPEIHHRNILSPIWLETGRRCR